MSARTAARARLVALGFVAVSFVLAFLQRPGWATSDTKVDLHVDPAGFLGDELPSERYPNAQLLKQALNRVRAGDILLAHLGIWSRKDPWAPAVLEPLIVGLKQRGLCFATLREHPEYAGWLRR